MLLLSRKFNNREGVVKINVHNTLKHELAKFLVAWRLSKEGKQFVTESVFENGKRADVFVLDDCEAIEVLESETEEMFKEKVKDYPCATFCVGADDVIKEVWVEGLRERKG
jgi:hypothetical protein